MDSVLPLTVKEQALCRIHRPASDRARTRPQTTALDTQAVRSVSTTLKECQREVQNIVTWLARVYFHINNDNGQKESMSH